MTKRALSLIGLCRRAGGVIPGADATLDTVRRGRAVAVLVACDASDRTKKQARDKTCSAGIPLLDLEATSDEIGKALGLTSPCAVLALTGKGPCASAIEAVQKSKTTT